MSFSFRDKGRLSDRLRGKTCDEILRELRDHLHQDRNMSFDSTPSWGGFSSSPVFSRAGFPFMDQNMMHRPDMRAHFEDLANRHPEFADHLRPTAWGTAPEMDPRFFQSDPFRQRHPSGGSGSGTLHEDDAIPIPVTHEDSGGGDAGRGRTRKIPQYGLRNTVDLGESQKATPDDKTDGDARSQRSWSAPPDNRTQGDTPNPKRFVTKVDINDKNNQPASAANEPAFTCSSGVSGPGKPPPVPKTSGTSSPQSQPQTSKSGNVRHIPIFVEGRDQPVFSKPREGSHSFASSQSSSGYGQPNYSYSYAQAPPGHHSSAFASSHTSSPPTQRRSQTNFPQASKPQPQPQPAPAPQEPKPTPPKQPQAPPKQALPKDPIAKVQAIQAEVNELKEFVEKFSGNSRTDKEYIYLDEMLTRNLIKLDDIETEGKENIRQARKEAIRSIQKCISILESKAPLPQDMTVEGGEEANMEEENRTESCAQGEETTEKSDVTSEGQSLEKMEVECTENKDALESSPVQSNDSAGGGETAGKAGETSVVLENLQSSGHSTEVSDQPSEKLEQILDQPIEKMEVTPEQAEAVSEQISEKMEVASDQSGEKMYVVSEQSALVAEPKPNEISASSVEACSDKCSSEVTNNPENIVTKTEVGNNVEGQPCVVIADATVVPETVKPSDSVEAPSEVNESSVESANLQDSAGSTGACDQKIEATVEKVVKESTESNVFPKEGAEKVVSS